MNKQKILDLVHREYESLLELKFIPGETYIPASKKIIDSTDIVYTVNACLDLHETMGKWVKEFEEELPHEFDLKTKALFVNSGSSANLLAIASLGLKPGDDVITAACAFPTTVNPIVQYGAIPVFVDVNPETLNADFEMIKRAYNKKTKAVVLAHTLGNPYRADELEKWCFQKGIYLVEDCCDALGATVDGRKVGSFGHYATCSFYPAHHITTGEGGALLSKSGQYRRTAESFRDWGRDCWCPPGADNTCKKRFNHQLGSLPCGYDHKYTYSKLGFNLKATDFQAALGLSQLKKLSSFIEVRRKNHAKLKFGVTHLLDYIRPIQKTVGTNPSWFGFPIMCEESIDRTKLTQYLEAHQIGTRLVFSGNLVRQPAYQTVPYGVCGDLTHTDQVMKKAFWIGVHPGIDDERIQYMLEVLEQGIREQVQRKKVPIKVKKEIDTRCH